MKINWMIRNNLSVSNQSAEIIQFAEKVWKELNVRFYSNRLSGYKIIKDNVLSGAPASAIAQTDAPNKTVHFATQRIPLDNGHFSKYVVCQATAHESIHAIRFDEGAQDWKECYAGDWKVWEKRIKDFCPSFVSGQEASQNTS